MNSANLEPMKVYNSGMLAAEGSRIPPSEEIAALLRVYNAQRKAADADYVPIPTREEYDAVLAELASANQRVVRLESALSSLNASMGALVEQQAAISVLLRS